MKDESMEKNSKHMEKAKKMENIKWNKLEIRSADSEDEKGIDCFNSKKNKLKIMLLALEVLTSWYTFRR